MDNISISYLTVLVMTSRSVVWGIVQYPLLLREVAQSRLL